MRRGSDPAALEKMLAMLGTSQPPATTASSSMMSSLRISADLLDASLLSFRQGLAARSNPSTVISLPVSDKVEDETDLLEDADLVAGAIWEDDDADEPLSPISPSSSPTPDLPLHVITARRKSLGEATKQLLEELDLSLGNALEE